MATKRELKAALAYKGVAANYYSYSEKLSPFLDEPLLLLEEAQKTYLMQCPKASIIIAGETLHRMLMEKLFLIIKAGTPFKTRFIVKINNVPIDLSELTEEQVVESNFLRDLDLALNKLIKIFNENEFCSSEFIELMETVRRLRNNITHKNIPLIIQRNDFSKGKSLEYAKKLLTDEMDLPEVYDFYVSEREKKFDPETNKPDWKEKIFRYTFVCNDYGNVTMKSLSPEEKLAAIQLNYLSRIILELFPKQ